MSGVKSIQTRVQNKHDIEAHWLMAASFVPLAGELIIYDAETKETFDAAYARLSDEQKAALGRTTPITYARAKVGDGKTLVNVLPFIVSSETDIILSEDLYTYTAIGKITSASNTSPVKVASAGENLKAVFNKVFGTQQDQQPSITTSGVKLSVSAGTTSYGGGEFGTAVGATDVTVTFTLANSGTAGYGYRCGDTKTTGSQTFYYPVTKQNNADLVITLPSDKTASSAMVTAGTFVAANGNLLYCNFNTDKKVSIKINLPAGSVSTSAQTRYGQISASVTLGAAQKENQLTAGTAITKFLTYLKNDATDTASLSGGTKTNTAGAYTISAGSKYVYWAKSSSTNTPASWTRLGNGTTSVVDMQLSCAANEYIWVATPGSYTSLYMFNDVSGKYNTDAMATTKLSNVTITNAQNASVSGYYVYRTTNAMSLATNTKFKLV